jgi:hypothetical protein
MPRPYHPAPPFSAPTAGSIDERLAVMAAVISRKQDQGIQGTAQQFMALISPNGTVYRIEIDDAGVMHTTVVPRT